MARGLSLTENAIQKINNTNVLQGKNERQRDFEQNFFINKFYKQLVCSFIMLTASELKKLKEELETSKKPLIFFDDDTDGTCSFLLYYRFVKSFCDDAKGIIVKNSPVLKDDMYVRKIEEYGPDKVFILDKPIVSQDFLVKVKVKKIWLDHHPLQPRHGVDYYNPLKHKSKKYIPDNRPTTYWAYKTIQKWDSEKKFLWIAMVGCIGDWFVPEFAKEFTKKYPDLLPKNLKIRSPGTVLHETELGKLCMIIQFNLKGPVNQVMSSIKILTRINDPYEILHQTTPQGKFIYKQYNKLHSKYLEVKSQIKVDENDPLIFFKYQEDYGFTSDLSNEMQYENPDKVILIAINKDGLMKCSFRSENLIIRDILEKSLIGIDGHGGGHEHACGAGINENDFDRFLQNLRENIDLQSRKKQQKIL